MRTKQQIMKKTISLLAVVMITTAFLSSMIVPSNLAHAVQSFESRQGISFTFNDTVAISITGGTGSSSDGLSINNLTPGDAKDSNIITVTAKSNAPLGYTLSSSVGSSTYNYTDLRKETSDSTNKFTNLSSNKASLTNFDAGTWGYSYSPCTSTEEVSGEVVCTNTPSWVSGDITSTTNSGYNGLPLYNTSSDIKLINTTDPGSSSIQFKIGAKANTTQLAGTYNNVVNFINVGRFITTSYTITYTDPSGEATNMPSVPPDPQSTHSGTTTTGAVQISSTVPVRTNYIFKGWCTVDNTADPSTCTGTGAETIQPDGFLALNPGTSSSTPSVTKDLYAIWQDNLPMQNLDPTLCTSTPRTVIDTRDGKSYKVVRFTDGKCWMTTNLDLTGGTALSADDTDVTSAYITNFTTSNNLTKSGNTIVLPASSTTGFDTDNYSYVANSNSTTCGDNSPCYSYYSWDAANLGSGRSIDTDNTDAPHSICPKGWHLPNTRNGTNSTADFRQLMIVLGGSAEIRTYNADTTPTGATMFEALSNSNLAFLRAGLYNVSTFYYGGSSGYYWSATTYSGTYARLLYFGSTSVHSAGNYERRYGFSVRCIRSS